MDEIRAQEFAANVARDAVVKGGGKVSFDEYDKLLESLYFPLVTLEGWDSDHFQRNQGVVAAQLAVSKGLIKKSDGYYEIITSEADKSSIK